MNLLWSIFEYSGRPFFEFRAIVFSSRSDDAGRIRLSSNGRKKSQRKLGNVLVRSDPSWTLRVHPQPHPHQHISRLHRQRY
jgi:hypothetical protein